MKSTRKWIAVSSFVVAFGVAAALTVALLADDEGVHAQASKRDPYYIYTSDQEGLAAAIGAVETKVGFELKMPTAPGPLEARIVAAVEGPPGEAVPNAGTRAVLDFYKSGYDLKPDVQPADYSGPRMEVVQFRGSLVPDERSVELPFHVNGFRVYRVSEEAAPAAVGYFLAGEERSYFVNLWAVEAGKIIREGPPPFSDATIVEMLADLAAK